MGCNIYPGWTGIYECADGWRKGVWKISFGSVWKTNIAVYDVCDSLCVGAVLPVIVSAEQKDQSGLCVPAIAGIFVPDSLLCVMENRSQALQIKRLMIYAITSKGLRSRRRARSASLRV